MTGNTIVNVLGSAVFFLWGPGTVMLLIGYFSGYYITFYQDGNRFVELLQKSSPAPWYIGAVSEPEKAGSMALWAVAVTVLLIALCVFLYKKRPSEAAGRAMAFRKKPAGYQVAPCSAGLHSPVLIFREMMGSDGWSIFGLVSRTCNQLRYY